MDVRLMLHLSSRWQQNTLKTPVLHISGRAGNQCLFVFFHL